MAFPLSSLVCAAYALGFVEARFTAIIILVSSPHELVVQVALVLTISLLLLTVVRWAVALVLRSATWLSDGICRMM
jgi:hypothetical protein